MKQPIEQMTLRDRLILAERSLREISDHLEKGVLPKVADLVELVHPTQAGTFPESLRDVTLRNYVGNVLKADEFTGKASASFIKLCESIELEIDKILASK